MVDAAAVKSSISDLITRVIEYPRGHDWNLPEPDKSTNRDFLVRPDYISTFLEIGRHINPNRFNGNTFEENFILSFGVSTPNESMKFSSNVFPLNRFGLMWRPISKKVLM